jgi:predicted nucleic acid-binding protein
MPAQPKLDIGEWEAISLALEVNPSFLLIDDRRPVSFARLLGIPVATTPLVLLAAKRLRLIGAVKDHLDALRYAGFWLTEAAYREVLRDCGEA